MEKIGYFEPEIFSLLSFRLTFHLPEKCFEIIYLQKYETDWFHDMAQKICIESLIFQELLKYTNIAGHN